MATEIIMPKAGMSMEEGTVVKWLKKEGDMIKKGEAIVEIHTDKVNMEVEAETSGVLLKITANEGDVLPVFTPIGYIGEEGEKIEISDSSEKSKSSKEVKEKEDIVDSNDDIEYDVIVIGGGPAGYVAAIKASQLGGKVALIEKDVVGGTCLNRGCIPTKTYLKNAEVIDSIKHAGDRGIILESLKFNMDMDKAVKYKNQVVKTLTNGVSGLLKSYGVDIFDGVGKIVSNKKVSINDKRIINGKNIILASGSKPNKIKLPGIESPLVLTSTEILDLKQVPSRLAIIGGGVIGVEVAMVFSSYGSKVTIIEMQDRIVSMMDKDISKELTSVLKKKGIEIKTSSRVQAIEEKNNELTIKLNDNTMVKADKALLSIGRVPDLEAVENIDLELQKGKVKVNEYMQTSIEGIYAPGDINGLNMLAHSAFKMGEVAAANAMGEKERVNLKNVPNCIYTSPEVGSVGLTQEEAKKQYDIAVGMFRFAANGRALASGEGVGFVKVIADKKYGEILGVHIIGPGAAEIINEAAALMEMEITVKEVASIIHGHPTFSEAFMEACADAMGECIHLPPK